MPPIPFADNFSAGAIISLLMPAGLLVAIVVWYWITARRIEEPGDGTAAPASNPAPGAVPPQAVQPGGVGNPPTDPGRISHHPEPPQS